MGVFSYIILRLWIVMRSLGRGDMEDIKYVGCGFFVVIVIGFYIFYVKE